MAASFTLVGDQQETTPDTTGRDNKRINEENHARSRLAPSWVGLFAMAEAQLGGLGDDVVLVEFDAVVDVNSDADARGGCRRQRQAGPPVEKVSSQRPNASRLNF
ncbi:hypothetical protein CLCR_00741 [Cladophialophora carrionii]|uniref:Uncharacterized protein n=1 Tax=Cladophialophora carrionii TaxID=86049 RepID=A0A1C1C6T0_9EURO|nr:hypothetical protein CLCR_00741 [Cladophialophora carrionii]